MVYESRRESDHIQSGPCSSFPDRGVDGVGAVRKGEAEVAAEGTAAEWPA